jgi:hypothetical protein
MQILLQQPNVIGYLEIKLQLKLRKKENMDQYESQMTLLRTRLVSD